MEMEMQYTEFEYCYCGPKMLDWIRRTFLDARLTKDMTPDEVDRFEDEKPKGVKNIVGRLGDVWLIQAQRF